MKLIFSTATLSLLLCLSAFGTASKTGVAKVSKAPASESPDSEIESTAKKVADVRDKLKASRALKSFKQLKLISFQCTEKLLREVVIANEAKAKTYKISAVYTQGLLTGIKYVDESSTPNKCDFVFARKGDIVEENGNQSCDVVKKSFQGLGEEVFPLGNILDCCDRSGCEKHLNGLIAEKTK